MGPDGERGAGTQARYTVMVRLPSILVAGLLVGTGGASVLGLGGAWVWWLDLFAHFRVQYLALLVIAVVLAVALRSARLVAAGVALLLLELVWVAPLLFPASVVSTGAPLRLAHFNVLSSNHAYAAAQEWISGSAADVVVVEEVSPRWAEALGEVPGYHARTMLARADNFGIGLLVRDDSAIEVMSSDIVTFAGLPAVALRLRHAGEPLALLGLHTLPPVSADNARTRDAQLVAAARWAAAQREAGFAPVVIGDFNATPFSAGIAPLIAAGLRDSLAAGGLFAAGSWPDVVGPLRIAIDHCWHDARLVTRARAIGPALGSDHRPLAVTLGWAE